MSFYRTHVSGNARNDVYSHTLRTVRLLFVVTHYTHAHMGKLRVISAVLARTREVHDVPYALPTVLVTYNPVRAFYYVQTFPVRCTRGYP